MFERFSAWMTEEPFITLMTIIAAVVLFVFAYKKKSSKEPIAYWDWMKQVIESATIAFAFRSTPLMYSGSRGSKLTLNDAHAWLNTSAKSSVSCFSSFHVKCLNS